MSSDSHHYLIIAGTTKAATTSVFSYLAAHPAVCVASVKETRFFLDVDYPLRSAHRWNEGGSYDVFYQGCKDGALRVEATPDYLYSPGTPTRLAAALPNARIVFLLRDPIERLASWHRFAQQNDFVEKGLSFETFVARQVKQPDVSTPQHYRALEQGRYARYLAPWFHAFGSERVAIVFMDDLANDPRATMRRLCAFAGLDPSPYDDYRFEVQNASVTLRSPFLHRLYMRTKFNIARVTHRWPRAKRLMRRARLAFEPVYLRLNKSAEVATTEGPDAATMRSLREYYAGEADALATLAGRPLPWRVAP